MRREDFDRLCRGVGSGEEIYVQNLDSLYAGKVLACEGDHLTVEAFGHRIDWDVEDCRPVSPRINPLGPPTNA